MSTHTKTALKALCLVFAHSFLVACSDVEPSPVIEPAPVEEVAPVVEVVEEVEEPIYYTAGGSRVRSEIFDKNIFYGRFADIPIPDGMINNKRFSDVKFLDDMTQGVEVYTGNFEINILSERMKQNMYDHFWTLTTSETTGDGTKITQVYQLDKRVAIVNISKRIVDVRLDVWNHNIDSTKSGDFYYISPSQSTTNPVNDEKLLPSSIRK